MSDLLWDDVRDFFDPDMMGALPDICVTGTSVEDWQAVFDLVQSDGYTWEYSVGGEVEPLPSAAEVLARPVEADWVALRVWPAPHVLAIFRPYGPEEIDFDVDLRELQGQTGVDILCGFLSAIGRQLNKPVLMTAEGGYGDPVLGFDPGAGRVMLLAGHQAERE
ncbi:hypothetical protein Aph01nite_68370 [Acrocarpospora phusangensis]|uniref:Uncharacterized protein n=1 Tax=Acrocarpospora phusangensis TaxID=1070424 RepID=A0A919QLT8_9ACTN|nr:hypothetical protein [Acrocarpospora phusangensis]GIH28527.1 hypothetical protein Aph01nite_68370 [Acrocarpospora phusangensis]